MAYFYVKSGFGIRATGGGTTLQTGSMATLGAANVYDNIPDAITDGAGAGDNIYCSDVHAYSPAGAFSHIGPTTDPPLNIVSVDDTNIDQYKKGASESTGGGSSNITMNGRMNYAGMTLNKTNDFDFSVGETRVIMDDCVIGQGSNGDVIWLDQDGCLLHLINTDMSWDASTTGGVIMLRGGSKFIWQGGAITGANNCDHLIHPTSGSNGGMVVFVDGVDLGNVDVSLFSAIDATGIDSVVSEIKACRLHASATTTDTGIGHKNQRIEMFNSSSTSAGAQQAVYIDDWVGTVEDQDDSGIHRADDDAFENGDLMSLKVTTNANCDIHNPLRFEIPSGFLALSNASTDTVRVYCAVTNATTLYTTTVWVDVYAQDGTNNHVYNHYSSRGTDFLNITGTALTDDSGSSDWRNGGSALTAHNEYRIDVDTSGDAAADCVPKIVITVAEPSETIYFAVVADGVA